MRAASQGAAYQPAYAAAGAGSRMQFAAGNDNDAPTGVNPVGSGASKKASDAKSAKPAKESKPVKAKPVKGKAGAHSAGNASKVAATTAIPTTQPQEPQEPKAPKAKKSRKGLKIAAGTIAAVLVVAYVGMSVFFMNHYGFNTQINGEDVSFKTVEETTSILKDQVDNYSIDVQKIDGTVEKLAGADVGLTYQSDERAHELLAAQQPFAWPGRIFSASEATQIKPTVTLDESLLKASVDKLAFMNPDNMVAPTDAAVGFDSDADQYVVMPEQWGSTVIPENVYQAVSAAMLNVDESVDLKAKDCYVPPEVYQDDEGLHSMADACNKYAASKIIYTLGDLGEEELDGTTVIDWIIINDEGEAELDPAQITAYVDAMAERYDTAGKDRYFTTNDGSVITVSGGYYGWKLNKKAEIAQIKEDMESQTEVTRDPCWSTTAKAHTGTEWGTTYVEVSIPAQHVWYYVDGSCVFDCDVVTGLPTAKRATGTGVFEILEKLSPTVLRGPQKEDGSYEWESPVTYWMRVTWSGTGLHDANWRGSFGGSIYQSNGSHGCINMPVDKAKELYGMIKVGTPVIIY